MTKYNVVVESEIGTFIVNKNDLGVGWQLTETGNYDPTELQFIADIMTLLRDARENLVALDIGANIGTHSIFLSREVGPKGKVYSFEAQRIVFNMLAGNVAINSIDNVYCAHNAVSDTIGWIDIPQFDYDKELSFGSVEFGGKQTEFTGQNPKDDPDNQEKVATITIDSLNFDKVDFLKIDVEGMELNVLQGAAGTIAKCRPVLLVEYLKSDSALLLDWLIRAEYRVYSGVGANFACMPKEFDLTLTGLPEMGV
jgi:FkbM family methyltransferase